MLSLSVNIDVDSAGAIPTESRAMVTAGGDRAMQQDDATTPATFQASVQPCCQARALEMHYGRTPLVAEAHAALKKADDEDQPQQVVDACQKEVEVSRSALRLSDTAYPWR